MQVKDCIAEEIMWMKKPMGAGRSGQWPENLFTGLNGLGHSGLSNFKSKFRF